MVFDTGASRTTIPARLAAKIGLTATASDPEVECKTADGGVVKGRLMTISTLQVGRFVVNSVDCVVMPASKADVDPLLGQSFLRHCKCELTPESEHLVMARVEGLEPVAPPPRRRIDRLGARPRTGRGLGGPGVRPPRRPPPTRPTTIVRIERGHLPRILRHSSRKTQGLRCQDIPGHLGARW
jgi:clan AA aspartic protease (TIGR02281 family)